MINVVVVIRGGILENVYSDNADVQVELMDADVID